MYWREFKRTYTVFFFYARISLIIELIHSLLYLATDFINFVLPKTQCFEPGWCGSGGWMSSHKPKGCRSNSWSGHTPELWARSLVADVQEASNRSMFFSHMDVSLPFSLSLSLSLKINKIEKKTQLSALNCLIVC